MRPRSTPGAIRPKISTMPRPKTEAAAFLDLYKLSVEKKRLQQELQALEVRRQQIGDRLSALDSQIATLETRVEALREQEEPASRALPGLAHPIPESFDMVFLEY